MKQSGALHAQIRRDIEARIMSGEWKPGDRIPYEHQLMATYGCSRMTVNRALRALVEAGLIESRKRAGTFVSHPRIHRAALEIPDIRDEVAQQDEEDRRLLQIDGGSVLAIECRHHAGGRPYALERRLINLAAVPGAAEVDFAVEPPGSWLLAHVPWTEAEHRITAVNAGAKELVALGIAAGAACMALERWTWRGAERITYARQVYPGDRYALVAHFRP
jgi:GntR family histidine utilization transcriptional repressor